MVISIIVRTFAGRELLLARALESIRAQEATEHTIQTVVAVDGGPIDEKKAGIARCSKVLVVAAGPPGGRSAAANAGLDAATGDLIGFLDDDDWFEPNHVRVLTGLLESNPGTAAAYAAAWQQEANLNVEVPAESILGTRTVFYRPTLSTLDLLKKNLFPIQAILFRRATLVNSGARFSTALDALEDWLFWQHLLIGEEIASTRDVTSTFLVPVGKQAQARRSDAHRRAVPDVLLLRQSIRVPIAVVTDLMRAKAGPLPARRRTPPATLGYILFARLDLLRRNRPKLRHKVEYAVLRAIRLLWRRTPAGSQAAARERKRRATAQSRPGRRGKV